MLSDVVTPAGRGGLSLLFPRSITVVWKRPIPSRCGTSGSTPFRSGGESDANLIFGDEAHRWLSGISPVPERRLMLQRNLVYTGVTRGKRLVVLVGQRKALAIAVKGA